MEKFPDLPYEIRLAILEGLARSVRYSYSTSADRLSTLAVVCKEWHKVFEPEIFRQLILSPFRLQDLHQNIKNRKSLVKHIWYDVELQRYSCDDCDRRESPDRKLANNDTAAWEIFQLFDVLSHWSRNGACAEDGLTLELSTHSPSDSMHHFKNHQFDTFFYADDDDFGQNPKARRLTPRASDASHKWDPPKTSSPALVLAHVHRNLGARQRVHGYPLLFLQELPKVEVVTRLLIRRQCYRAFGPGALHSILEALPMLKQIHIESWRSPFYLAQPGLVASKDQEMEYLVGFCMPTMLKELTLYEDHDGFYELLETNNRPSRPSLAVAILGASARLESLVVSFLIDARNFFMPSSPSANPAPHAFPRLQFLALTSNELSSGSNSAKRINNLLRAAGSKALRMPNLRVMELWTGRRGEAAIFRYEQRPSSGTATLTWLSSWNFSPDPEVIAQWNKVALRSRCQEFKVNSDRIPAPPVCPGSVLKYLHLRRRILHPLSLYQIQQEADQAEDTKAWLASRNKTTGIQY